MDIAVQTDAGHVLPIDAVADVTKVRLKHSTESLKREPKPQTSNPKPQTPNPNPQVVKSGDDLYLVSAEIARKTDNTRPAAAGGGGGSANDASRQAAGADA